MNSDLENTDNVFRGSNLGVLFSTLLVGSIYFITGKFGLSLAFVNASATAVWPPTGIALVAFLVFGRRIWPGVMIGAFLVNLTTAGNILTSLGIAAGNTLEGVIGAYLVETYAGGRQVLNQPRNVFMFVVLAAILSTTISATIGVTTLALGGYAKWGDLTSIWLTWWLGDASGDLVVAPILLLWIQRRNVSWNLNRFLEAVLLFTAILIVSLVAFAQVSHEAVRNYPLTFLCPPVLITIAFRLHQRETATSAAILSAIAVWGTMKGLGPFNVESKNESLLLLQTYLSINAIMALLVASVVSSRKVVLLDLRKSHADLDIRIQERTSALSKAYEELQVEMTERRRSEEKLKQSQRQLAEAQHIARVGSWGWDVEKDVVTWSDELYQIFGLKQEDFAGTYAGYLERVHPDDKETVHREVDKAFRDHKPFGFEHRIVLPNGVERVILSQGRVVCDPSNRPVQMYGTAQDITERKRGEEKFRGLLESAPDAMIISDHQGRIILVNSQTEIMFGYTRQELLGKPVEILLPARFQLKHVAHRGDYSHEPRSRPMGLGLDLFGLRKDGREFPVEISLSPMKTPDGLLVTAVVRDITERKRTEQQIQLLGHTITSMNECVVITDMERRITFVNPAFVRMYGYSEDEVRGKNISMLRSSTTPGENLDSIQVATLLGGWDGELMNIRKNGEEFPIFLTTSVVRNRQGEPIAMVGTWRDITERKEAELRIAASQRELREYIDHMSTMSAKVAPDGTLLLVNRQAEVASGLPHDELMRTKFTDGPWWAFDKKVQRRVKENFRKAVAGESINYEEQLFVFGKIITISFSLAPVFGEDGNVSYLLAEGKDITGQKQAEEKIRMLGHTVTSMNECVIITDMNNNIMFINQAFTKTYGYEENEILGKHVTILRSRNVPEDIAKEISTETLRNGWQGELMNVRKNGEEFPILLSTSIIYDRETNPIAMVGITRDITEIKKVEEEIRTREDRFNLAVDSAEMGAWDLDLATDTMWRTVRHDQIFGYKKLQSEWGYKIFLDHVVPEDRSMVKKYYDDAYKTGDFSLECRIIRADNQLRWILQDGRVFRNEKGEPVRMMGVVTDITERKQAQEALRRWGQIFENAEFGIVIVSADGETLELMNPRMTQMHGYTLREFNSKRFSEIVSPNGRIALLENIGMAQKKGHHTFESENIHKDKSVFPAMMDITAVKDHQGRILYYIIHIQDITERKRIELQAKEAYKKEVLLKEIHHRVKNNLQTVASMLSLQSDYIKDKKALDVFTESQNRIKTITLIHEKLYQSKDLGKVEMSEYFDSLVINLVRSYTKRPSTIVTNLSAEGVSLGVDTAIPCGLIVNELVSNCLKHAFHDGVKGEIDVSLHQTEDEVYRLQVRDNGVGFPPEIDFRHTSSLGLQLVNMFVQQLHGTIDLHSNNGAQYVITFKEVIYADRG